MRWRPWPPLVLRKYEVRLIVRRLEGCDLLRDCGGEPPRLTVEIRWKGPKLTLGSLRRTPLARNFTREADVAAATVAQWDEEFQSLCNLNAYKDNAFHPWEIAFTVFNVSLSLSLSLCFILFTLSFLWVNGICLENVCNYLKIG